MSTNIDGTVTAISHVFYLSGTSKSFWIQVLMKNEDKPRNILIPVEKTVNGTFKNVQIYPEKYLGKQFTVKNVKRSNLSMNSGYVKIYRTNEYSTIDQVPTSIVSEPPANYNSKSKPKKSGGLINIEGIVTNDKFVQAGIFILDNKITVVISSLCVITNIKEVQSGHKVSIRNGHILKMANQKTAVILCAKSLLIIHKQQVDPDMDGDGLLNLTGKFSIHNSKSERERFESNVFIQDCLHLRLSPKQSLKLFEYLTILEKNIKEMKNSDLKQNLFLDYASSNHANKNNNLEHLIDFFNVEIKKVPHRSLLNEFLSYPHQCSVDVPDDSDKWPNINNLKTTMNTIEEYLKSQDNIDSHEKTNTPCRYKYQILKSNEEQ